MNNTPKVDTKRFWEDGYLIVKGVFSREEIEELRYAAADSLKDDEARGLTTIEANLRLCKGDLLSKIRLRHIVLDDRMLSVARQILGARPVYFGDSSYQAAMEWGTTRYKGGGWHKDNRRSDRDDVNGLDWQGRYNLVRIGLYLQDHAQHSGAVAVRVGSHLKAGTNHGKPVFAGNEIGDLVVWNLRTTHAGQSVRLKFWPSKKFSVKVEWRAPFWLCVRQEKPRIALFVTYGIDDAHTRRYMDECRSREDCMEHFRNSHFDENVWNAAAGKDLNLVRVIPEYGTIGAVSE